MLNPFNSIFYSIYIRRYLRFQGEFNLLEINDQALIPFIPYRTLELPKQLTTLTPPLYDSTKSKPRSYLASIPPSPPLIELEIRSTKRAQVPTEARNHSLENEIPSRGATIHPKVQVRSTRNLPSPRLRVAVKIIHPYPHHGHRRNTNHNHVRVPRHRFQPKRKPRANHVETRLAAR